MNTMKNTNSNSNTNSNTTNRTELRAFRTYGLTGQDIKIRSKGESSEYNPWGTNQVPVKITGEYPNFLTATVLPHKNPVTGRMSGSYPITIHKHDIILQEVVPEYGDRIDYGDGTGKVDWIQTMSDLRKAVSEATGVKETENMINPARWMITEVENSITSCTMRGIVVEIFPSGFIAASFGYREEVFRIEELTDDYRDRYTRKHYRAEYFTDLPWEIRLLLEAEDRLGIRVLIDESDYDEDDADEDLHESENEDRVETVKKLFGL